MKFQIYKIILVIALCLSLCACSQEPKAIVLPDVDDIVSIQISFDEITESHKDAVWIEKAICGLADSESTNKESVQDAPDVERYLEINIEHQKGCSTLFVYEQDDKFYVEQPYQGIWEIESELYSYLADTGENGA